MTVSDLVRFYFPNATDSEIGHTLFSATGFPAFWHIPRDGKTPQECLARQLYRAARIHKKGLLDKYIAWAWDTKPTRARWFIT